MINLKCDILSGLQFIVIFFENSLFIILVVGKIEKLSYSIKLKPYFIQFDLHGNDYLINKI